MFESLETCPDDLLLFMHHVPYTHVLKNGKTVIQHFYDEHYRGAEDVAGLVAQWRTLAGWIDDQRFNEVLSRLEYQAGHAIVWRDSICNWFMRRSGTPDDKGRVGKYPNRYEAEKQRLNGYQITDIKPWEAASGSRAIQLVADVPAGSVRMKHAGAPGTYDLVVQYFDEEDGASSFKLIVADRLIDEWQADGHVPTPTTQPDAHSSTRRVVRNVDLKPGDEIRIEGRADADERAGIDYIEVVRSAEK
jgi:alpha-glucuronidase